MSVIENPDWKKIKGLAIVALVSDDVLLERLVLKGGNAIDLIYGLGHRASFDLDFSMDGDVIEGAIETWLVRIEALLTNTFRREGYFVFDVRLHKKPREMSTDMVDFWGGYRIEFKIVPIRVMGLTNIDLDRLRKQATIVGPMQQKTFNIDLSRHEYCAARRRTQFLGYALYVYPPTMLVAEKLRAICQQMEEYRAIVKSQTRSARAKDFFDISILCETNGITGQEATLRQQIEAVFDKKRVPLRLLARVQDSYSFHEPDFQQVKSTVPNSFRLREFRDYFDEVCALIQRLRDL